MKVPTVGTVLVVLALGLSGQFFLAQQQIPWTLWVGIGLMGAALWKVRELPFPEKSPRIAVRKEVVVFSGIFLLAVCAYLWRIDSFPAGLHMDQGKIGWNSLRVLYEGWRPMEEALDRQNPYVIEFYQLAGWFYLFRPSLLTFHLFFVLISLAALPFFYVFFKRLSGPIMALVALFFMAVMRWQWIEVRNAHSSCEAPFYVMAMLALLLTGFQNRKPIHLAGAALFAGLGLYAYQSLKVLPLLAMVLVLFEYFHLPEERKAHQQALRWCGFLFLILALPLLHFVWTYHGLGKREAELFVLKDILSERSLTPLLRSIGNTAILLNREGDWDAFHNLPGHRMLDDFTGILFLLGLGMAWRWRKERRGAYPLIGLIAMALPDILTSQASSSQRDTGLLPFVAYFAAVGTVGMVNAVARAFKESRVFLWIVGGLLLFAVAAQNAYTYFGLEAADPRCQEASGPEQAFIGEEIARLEQKSHGHYRYFLGPFFQHNPTIAFLGYAAADRIEPFEIGEWAQGKVKRDKDALVFLSEGKSGTWLFLKNLFAGSQTGIFRKPDGEIGIYMNLIPVSGLQRIMRWNRGLKGIYLQSDNWSGPPSASRLDPLINFASREGFPFQGSPPFRVRWSGTLEIKMPGDYEFNVLSPDSAQLWLDGQEVSPEKPLYLARGLHSLRLDYEKDSGYYMALHLVWKKPDGSDWEVVPAEAFGVVR